MRMHSPPSSTTPDITPLIAAAAKMDKKFESERESEWTTVFQSRRDSLSDEYKRITINLTDEFASRDATNLTQSINALMDLIDEYLSLDTLRQEIYELCQPMLYLFDNIYTKSIEQAVNVTATFLVPCLTLLQAISMVAARLPDTNTVDDARESLEQVRTEARRLKNLYDYSIKQHVVNIARDGLDEGRYMLQFDLNVSNTPNLPVDTQETIQKLERLLKGNEALLQQLAERTEDEEEM